MRRYMMTAHSQFVGCDEGGAPVQLKYNKDTQNRLVVLPETYETVLTDTPLKGVLHAQVRREYCQFLKR